MATCLDYAKIACAAYYKGMNQYYDPDPGHMVDDWTVQKWEKGTLFGDGFQGGIWQNATDVVVGCCGTNTKQKGKFIADLIADIKIALRILPSQCNSARKMVRAAKQIAGPHRRVSVCGHSLGGGLAQVVGVWEKVPFVTFNAPAMKTAIKTSKIGNTSGIFGFPFVGGSVVAAIATSRSTYSDDAPGVNFRIRGIDYQGNERNDVVSSHFWGAAGDHVGMVVDLPAQSAGGAHGKATCWQSVLSTDWSEIDPFG